MNKLTLDACAKLNLTLDVGEKRPDGYHNMEMLMQSVSLYDTVDITLTTGKDIEVMSTDPSLPTGIHNLAGKAAKAFLSYVNITDIGVEVYITKRIPDRAGLAGGSADAAAVIRGLDRLLDTRLSARDLSSIALAVGSDVPCPRAGGAAHAAAGCAGLRHPHCKAGLFRVHPGAVRRSGRLSGEVAARYPGGC